jgi:hypothetical protein
VRFLQASKDICIPTRLAILSLVNYTLHGLQEPGKDLSFEHNAPVAEFLKFGLEIHDLWRMYIFIFPGDSCAGLAFLALERDISEQFQGPECSTPPISGGSRSRS